MLPQNSTAIYLLQILYTFLYEITISCFCCIFKTKFALISGIKTKQFAQANLLYY